jgi:hypothetical protein
LAEDDKKIDPGEEEEVPKDESEFTDESLLSFIEPKEEGEGEEGKKEDIKEKEGEGEPEPAEEQPRGLKVDDVLARKHLLEKGIPAEPPAEPVTERAEVTEEGETSPADTQPPSRPIEIHSPEVGDEVWKVEGEDKDEIDARVRASQVKQREYSPEEKVKVDQKRLAKLDRELKDELERLREKSREGVIPGEFLEARRRLADEGVLECPRCRIKVPDTPGKIDYCPKCGLAIDDYFSQYRREWEEKHKRLTSEGVKKFAPKKPLPEKTKWERWKEDQGVDPEAELLVCPECDIGVYDDPFIANKCPQCGNPLDLHLQFPREYVRKREAKTKGRRYDMLKDEFEVEKGKTKGKRKK